MAELLSQSHESLDQVSAIPFRRHDERLEFCLITSIRKRRWGFPKEIIDPGETLVETALKEAHEEAGLSGRIVGPPPGHYQYHKWGIDLRVTVVLMEVCRCNATWDEDFARERRWVSPDDARRLLAKSNLAQFLEIAVRQLADSPL